MNEAVIPCDDLAEATAFLTGKLGFRVEMVMPADEPSVTVLSGHGIRIRLETKAAEPAPLSVSDGGRNVVISRADDAAWIEGRAGMEYRDLIPGKLGGRLVASLIRLPGGPVADYVHYHKVRFQMIYCWHGRVLVVYEDQGEPFWLHPGDCVLQPPEIRHRVLEATAGAQVIELTSPGTHETWADHEMQLPTPEVVPEKIFGGQAFVHRKVADSTIVAGEFGGFESHHFGIATATGGTVRVFELRSPADNSRYASEGTDATTAFMFLLAGRLDITAGPAGPHRFTPGDSILIPPNTSCELSAAANTEILRVEF